MLYFFYGEETFRLKNKLDQVIRAYQTKHSSGLNLKSFNGIEEKDIFNNFKNFIQTVSIFNEKRLVMVRNILSLDDQEIEKLTDFLVNSALVKTDERFVVLTEEGVVDEKKMSSAKRKLFNFLVSAECRSQKFSNLSSSELKQWIKEKVNQKEGNISEEAIRELIIRAGSDLFRLSNEIEKLIHYHSNKRISLTDIQLLVEAPTISTTFQFVDALADQDQPKAMKLLWEQFYQKNEKPELILGALIYQFRNLLAGKELVESGENKFSIQKKLGVPYFVANKIIFQTRKFTLSQLKSIYHRLAQLDYLIKMGRVDLATDLELMIAKNQR